jgi:hypothetical protein
MEDWEGRLYCGILVKWDYRNKTVNLPMPGYIEKTVQKFQHKAPDQPQNAPYPAHTPQYGPNVQLTSKIDVSSALAPGAKKRIQHIVGSLLYYARASDPTTMA